MNTTADKLNRLLETKAAIKDGLNACKAGTVTDATPFSQYAGKIRMQGKTIDSKTTVYSDDGYLGLSAVTLDDPNLVSQNIVSGKTVLGVAGTAVVPAGTVSITANGPADVRSFASADVDVPNSYSGSVTIVENGDKSAEAKGRDQVVVAVPASAVTSGDKEISLTGQVDVTEYRTAHVSTSGLSAQNIKKGASILGVAGSCEPRKPEQAVSFTPSQEAQTRTFADTVVSSVTVAAIPETSESFELTAATQTVLASDRNAPLSSATVTASLSSLGDIVPGSEDAAFAVPEGKAGFGGFTVKAVQTEALSGFDQVTANGSYTPSPGKYFSQVDVKVPASAVTSGIVDITLTGYINVAKYKTAHVVDPNLVPANIRCGVTILGVTGTFGRIPYLAPVYNTEGVPSSGVSCWNTVVPDADYVELSSSTSRVVLGSGQYVVSGDVVIDGGVECAGDVQLILCDGCKLTI